MAKDIDEDLIEATIRRVAESKAARGGAPVEMPVGESVAPEVQKPPVERAIEAAENDEPPARAIREVEEDDFEVAPTPLRAAMGGTAIGGGPTRPAPARQPAPRPAAIRPSLPEREPVRQPERQPERHPERQPEPAASNNHAEIAEIAAELRAINKRLDVITSLIEERSDGATPSIGPAWEQAKASTVSRPAIFRDDQARPAPIEPEPEIIDTRPIPAPLPPIQVEPKRGFDLLPRSYRITVEDKRRGVDLVPLHRAMLSMEHVRDMSLLSYNNGVAIVALETTDELNPDELAEQVSRAMSREARVEVHNEHTMVVKLADE